MDENTAKKQFAALSGRASPVALPIPPRGRFHRAMQKLGLAPRTRTFRAVPITCGARARCASFLNRATLDGYADLSVQRAAMLFAANRTDDLVSALAAALWNRDEDPPEWLIKAIRNADQPRIDGITAILRESINASAFLESIISMTGVSLQPEEIIAPDAESPAPTH